MKSASRVHDGAEFTVIAAWSQHIACLGRDKNVNNLENNAKKFNFYRPWQKEKW